MILDMFTVGMSSLEFYNSCSDLRSDKYRQERTCRILAENVIQSSRIWRMAVSRLFFIRNSFQKEDY